MIKIIYGIHSIKITGHAGYAESGRDIVCAAVSTGVYVLANAAERMWHDGELEGEPTIRLELGLTEIIFVPKPEYIPKFSLVSGAVYDTFEQIRKEYPDFVLIKRI